MEHLVMAMRGMRSHLVKDRLQSFASAQRNRGLEIVSYDIAGHDKHTSVEIARFVFGTRTKARIRGGIKEYRYPGFIEREGVVWLGQSVFLLTPNVCEVREGFLVTRASRDVWGGAMSGVRLHRQFAVQEETHLPRDARRFPFLPRAKRPCAGETLPDRRAVAGRRLLRPGECVSVPTVGDQPAGEPPGESPRDQPALRPVHRHRQRREDGPTFHPVRDDGSSRVQLPRSSDLLEGSHGRAVPALPDG